MIGTPDSKVQGVNMGPIWGRQDPGGPHVGPLLSGMVQINPFNTISETYRAALLFNFA